MARAVAAPRSRLRGALRRTTAAAILDAAEQTIAERGLAGASISAIARRAGVAVGTVYNYYADREALVAAIFRTRRAELTPRLHAALVLASGRFPRRLAAYLGGVLAVFDDSRSFVRVALAAEQLRPRGGGRRGGGRPLLRQILDDVGELLAAGAAEGAIAADDLDLAAHVLVGGLRAALLLRLAQDRPFAADGERLAALFLAGAAVRR